MSDPSTPRIPPGGRRELGLVNDAFASLAGRVVGGHRPNVFTTLGRQRRLFRAWLWFSARLMPGGLLPRTETELVILHVAALRGCVYEQNHHRRIGARVGLDAERIAHAGALGWSGWTARERALLSAVSELVTERDVADDTWDALRTHLDEPRAIELLMLVGQYDALATTLMTLRVQPEG